MKLTLDAAAKQVGTSKSTLLRAIRSGALSAERAGDRAFRVDPSELSRWREARANDAPPPEPGRATAQLEAAPDATREAEAWRVRAEAAERMLAQEREERERERSRAEDEIADLRRRLDAAGEAVAVAQATARDIAAALSRQLPPPEAPVTARPRRWRLWGR